MLCNEGRIPNKCQARSTRKKKTRSGRLGDEEVRTCEEEFHQMKLFLKMNIK
jgi:hypothetical protein